MPSALTRPAAPDPDYPDPAAAYVSESELRDRCVDPALVPIVCPWAVELRAHNGSRCWSRLDLASLLEGNP